MRRILIVGILTGVGFVIVRVIAPKLRQQGISVAAPVEVVEADAVEGDEVVGGYVDGTRHPGTVPRRART